MESSLLINFLEDCSECQDDCYFSQLRRWRLFFRCGSMGYSCVCNFHVHLLPVMQAHVLGQSVVLQHLRSWCSSSPIPEILNHQTLDGTRCMHLKHPSYFFYPWRSAGCTLGSLAKHENLLPFMELTASLWT